MKKFSRVTAIIIFCAVSASVLTTVSPLSGEYRFREFRDDRNRFERYAEEAEKELSAEEWQSILDSGREEMRASWEKGADEEVRRYLREGGDEDEIRGTLEEARAQWERDFNAEQAMAKGAWYFQREALTSPAVSLQGLKNRVGEANSDNSIENIEDWDAYVKSALDSVNSSWSSEFNSLIDAARLKGASITNVKEREAFEQELTAFEKELKGKFSLERDSVLYLGRNSFIAERYTDTDSLRRKSEAESAEAITEEVIQGVENEISREEDKILSRSFSGDGSESINFSNMGDNWQEELKKLIETGMGRWNAAREKLYNEMLSWKNSAQEAFENIEAKWRLALEKLEKARGEWEQKLRTEIYTGLENWVKSSEELDHNIDTARTDLETYMENLSAQWGDHSSNLVEMAVNGSKVYSEALDNIKWLEGMVSKSEYSNRGAFGFKGESKGSTENFKSILTQEEINRIQEKISSLPGFDTIQQRYNLPYEAHRTGRMVSSRCHTTDGERVCSHNEMNKYLGHHYYTGGYYKYEYAGAEEFKDENGNWGLRETYTVRVYGNKVTYSAEYASGGGWRSTTYKNYLWKASDALVDTFTITNEVKSDYTNPDTGELVKGSENYEKSTYFYYKTELERWKNIRDSFSSIAGDAEYYMHEMNMLGEGSGAGYLTNDNTSENDPYLMTGAEFNYELSSRDRDFWERRLEIAKAVRDYAYPENGKRESASETEERKESAKSAMDKAKSDYEDALSRVRGITEELKRLQGVRPLTGNPGDDTAEWNEYELSIEYLSQKYSQAGEKLKVAGDELEARRKALIIVENGRDSSYIAKEIQEIEQNILNSDLELRKKREEYYSTLRENEKAAAAASFAEKYSSAARGVEDAKVKLALIAGEENDSNLVLWSENIVSSKTLVWGETTAADENAGALINLVDEFKNSGGSEKDALRSELSSVIRNFYSSFMAEFKIQEGIFTRLKNRGFDPGSYLNSGYNQAPVYTRYSQYSLNALNIIENALDHVEDTGGPKNYEAAASYLQGLAAGMSFVYGGDNSNYIEHYTALNILNERYRGLTPETWEGTRDRLEWDIETSEKTAALHNNRSGFDIASCEAEAAQGDARSIILMREYYTPGSAMTGIQYIEGLLGSAAIYDAVENEIRAYVEANYGSFYKTERDLEERDYLTGLLGYINNYAGFTAVVGEDVVLTADNLKELSPRQMALAAEAAADYVENFERNGVPVPQYLRKMVEELSSMKSGLDASLLITDYMTGVLSGTPDEIYSHAVNEKEISDSVAGFIAGVDELINAKGYGLAETVANIIAVFEALSEDAKKYISENSDDAIKGISELVSAIESSFQGWSGAAAADAYVANGGGLSPSDYADLNGLTGSAKDAMVEKLTPFYNKINYDTWLSGGGTGGIDSFIVSRNLTGEAAEELRRYALVKSYMKVTASGNYDSADPALAEYITERKVQDYIASNGIHNGEDQEEYIERIVTGFTGENGGDSGKIREFVEGFLTGDFTAVKGLPDEVKRFALQDYYYRSVHLAGGTLADDDIEDLLIERFGEGSLNSDIIESVLEYAAGLRGSLLYAGQDPDLYRGNLDERGVSLFNMGYYAGESSLLPMYEAGVYGLAYTSGSLSALSEGLLSEALGSLNRALGGAYYSVRRDLKIKEGDAAAAKALLDFSESGAGGKCWRDYILPANIEVKDDEGNVIETLVTHIPLGETGEIYDEINTSTGERTGVKYAQGLIERDGKEYSLSNLADNANRMHDVFAALFKGIKPSDASSLKGIGDFLDETAGIYSVEGAYTKGGDGLYSYESALIDRVSEYRVLAGDYASGILDLESAISALSGSLAVLDESLKSSRESYELMGGSKDEILKLYEESRVAHEAVKAEYAKTGEELAQRQQFYSERNGAYIDQMNLVSSLYSSYQGAEFDYEKAYQVWEYANTPYIKGEAINDGGLSGGESVTGGTESYTEIPFPDAIDVYKRIEARYLEADAEFKKREEEKNTQETTDNLNRDAEYADLKNELVKMSETYIRSSQVDAELEEKIGKYENDYINAQNAYTGAKQGLNVFADMSADIQKSTTLSGEEKTERIKELEEVRDRILSHINTAADRGNFLNGLLWYSCKTTWHEFYETFIKTPLPHYDADKQYLYRKMYADQYDNLPAQTRADIELLYSKFGSGSSLKAILENYDNYVFSVHMAAYCDHRYHRCKKHQISDKRMWRNRRNNYRGEMNAFYGKYYSHYNNAVKGTGQFLNNKKTLINASIVYNNATSVRYLSQIKEYLGGDAEKYNLTEEDLGYLYDAMSEGYIPDENSLNIEALRREKQRTDIDGLGVKAKIINGRVVLLDKDGAPLKLRDKNGNVRKDANGNALTENYAAGDRSVILKDSEGNVITEFTEGEEYNFYDNNYDISSLTGALKNHTLQRRNECYEKLMNYVKKTTSEGTHDYTIILRDLETTYHGMQETAVNFNSANEYRQRGFEGYGTITSEYVNNGTGESIQGFILEEMMKQNRQFQEQLWAQQREKFDLRRERWEEVTGYILNRGTRDWRVMETDFINQWRKWRFEAKREIEAGEKWWEERDAEMKGEMKTWGEETGKASSKAAAEKIYNDLTGKIESYEKNIKNKMPKGMNFDIDTDKILSETMRSIPLDSIDILSKSMFETDTTAGFAEMLNLGLSSSLFKYNEQKMEEYREAVGIMKNLQVIDILNGIIENFNSQLEEANENVYDAVDISLAKSENFAEAPFMRRDAEHQWEIRVCVESNLTGDKYKTRRFTDYNYYINSTVKLQPIKGLNGTTIDFTNANTYAVLDSEELDTYVGLEQDDLNKRIDEVFGEQGLFGAYQEGEFNRLGAEFVKYYSEWMEGEALLGSMFYSKPMFPNGPNMLQAAAIAASFTGQAYIAVLVAAATSGIQMADGSMTWEQAAFQIGVSTATAAIGAGAAKLGDMAGSAAGSALVGVAVKSTTTAVGNTLVSGVTLEGGSLGWDGDRMTSWKTWAGTGIMAAAGTVAEGYCKSDLSKAVVRGAGSGASRGVETGDYSESMRIALATSVGNYLGGLANGAIAGGTGVSSFAVENFVNFGMRKMLGSGEDFSWDMVAKNDALENLLSEYVTEAFMSDEQIRAIRERDKAEAEKREQDRYKLDFLDRIETAVGGMFLSMRDDFNKAAYDLENAVDTIGDGLKIAARAVSD
ncbi:MAG TPA: hypothetical protein P5120_15075, partial [Spirochaetota bacterium]|nr:hypothetical protein [Spirochaetota bacterium]